MDPKVWGPKAWDFLHSVTLAYPQPPSEEDKDRYSAFFRSVGQVLPCVYCRKHFSETFDPQEFARVALKDRVSMFKWSVDFHNKVNQLLQKKQVTYKEALDRMDSLYARRQPPSASWVTLALLLVLVLCSTAFRQKQ